MTKSMTSARAGVLVTLLGTWPVGLSGQAGGQLTGNPTPGTTQPEPPKLADRITLTGCVERAPSIGQETQKPADANTPDASRYLLTGAKRENRVPPGTGTSAVATAAVSETYKLAAIESVLSPFVGTRVEISGGVEPSSTKTEGVNANAPTLQVEFVQKLAPNCR